MNQDSSVLRRLLWVLIIVAGWSAQLTAQEIELETTGFDEAARFDEARKRMPAVTARYQSLVDAVETDGADVYGLVRLGRQLWRTAAADVQPDDRSLYWARLAMQRLMGGPDGVSESLRDSFAAASRGMDDVRFPDSDHIRVLITGFDPFLLDRELTQSNPSGLAALTLDGTEIVTEGRRAWIEAAMMPVRFSEFDAGLVERFFEPLLADGAVDLIVTISMGRDAFDLERFPGRRRSAEVPDNLNVLTGASGSQPLIPMLDGAPIPGPEFVEFSLPAQAMSQVSGQWPVRDNRQVTTLERGAFAAVSLTDLKGQTAVRGSGGGYLSNEISFRSVRLARSIGSSVPIGHLHTPTVVGYDSQAETAIVAQIREILAAAVAAL